MKEVRDEGERDKTEREMVEKWEILRHLSHSSVSQFPHLFQRLSGGFPSDLL